MAEDSGDEILTLRIAGLGHSIALEVPSESTVGELKVTIESNTKLPVEYQKLLARGSKLEDNDVVLSQAGIKNRTKIMLMHSAVYAAEKEGFELLSRVEEEIDELAAKKDSLTKTVIREFVTRICCKLDEIQIQGSTNLRARRKMLLQRAEALDQSTAQS